jgi:hypothetical protein
VLLFYFVTQTAHFEGETTACGSQTGDYYVGLINPPFTVRSLQYGELEKLAGMGRFRSWVGLLFSF